MGVLDNLGYVKSAALYPCAKPDPFLIIEAAGSAIAPVLLEAGTFGCLDILRMRAGISPWHSRQLRSLISNAISPSDKNAFNKLYKFLIPLEKAFFFFFVVDLTTQFVARWQSQIFKLGACGDFPVLAEGTASPVLGLTNNEHDWHNIFPANFELRGQPGLIEPPYIFVPPGHYMQCSFSTRPVPLIKGQTIGVAGTRLRQIHNRPYSLEPMLAHPTWYDSEVKGFYSIQHLKPKDELRVFVMEHMTDVLASSEGGNMSVVVSDKPIFNLGIMPANCFGKVPDYLQPHI